MFFMMMVTPVAPEVGALELGLPEVVALELGLVTMGMVVAEEL
jgi:hypothetical protein